MVTRQASCRATVAILSEVATSGPWPTWRFSPWRDLVPLYPTLPAGQIAPLLADSGVVGAFVSDTSQQEKLGIVRAQLRFVWNFDAAGLPQGAEPPGAAAARGPEPRGDDVATIIYTSGTTGVPKGVMLTHSNIASETLLSLRAMAVGPEDTYLSFLPLSHVFERCAGLYTMLYAGVTIAYAESIDGLAGTCARCTRPSSWRCRACTRRCSRRRPRPPRAEAAQEGIFDWAYRVAVQCGTLANEGRAIPPLLSLEHALAGALVYKKIVAGLGGRSNLRVSGGAPLQREVGLFFRGAGLPIYEGYGLTETSAAITVNTFTRHRVGTVGPLLEEVEVRIAPDGEVLVAAPWS